MSTIAWFRDAIPHVHRHRGSTFVVLLNALSQTNAKQILHDIADLHTLGIRVVLVHGARDRIDQCVGSRTQQNHLRVTDAKTLTCVKQANAMIKLDIEAMISEHAQSHIISGNFITAQPLGIIDGVDYQHTGTIRHIDAKAIIHQLDKHIVLLSPLGYASTGEVFNLRAEQIASHVATALHADKLILLHDGEQLQDNNGNVLTDLTASEAKTLNTSDSLQHYLDSAVQACEQGVARVHILHTQDDGILLKELFSSYGHGTMVTTAPYETTRPAVLADAASIMQLIQPLIDSEILVERSHDSVSEDIHQYYVLERDEKIIGTIALIPYPETTIGEVACVAIDPEYRGHNRGKVLLKDIETLAKQQGLSALFVMSTQTSHWFIEQGYQQTELAQLPLAKQTIYNTARNAKPYLKTL